MRPDSTSTNITVAHYGSSNCEKDNILRYSNIVKLFFVLHSQQASAEWLFSGVRGERRKMNVMKLEADDCLPSPNTHTLQVFCRLSNARCSALFFLLNTIKHSTMFEFDSGFGE